MKKIDFKIWLRNSEEDIKVAENLFKLKHYSQSLFFCHLSLEKLLKAIIIKNTKNYPPYIHDLRRLAEMANISLDIEKKKFLDQISTFNIAGRYANEKIEFYEKYNNKKYVKEYLDITIKLRLWLKKEYQKRQKK